MTGPEHYQKAERLAEMASEEETAMAQAYAALAQVHATLALVAATMTGVLVVTDADEKKWGEMVLPVFLPGRCRPHPQRCGRFLLARRARVVQTTQEGATHSGYNQEARQRFHGACC